jgi:hypothetical protein
MYVREQLKPMMSKIANITPNTRYEKYFSVVIKKKS